MFWYLFLLGLICVDFGLETLLTKYGVLDANNNSFIKKTLRFIFKYRLISIAILVFMSTFKSVSCGSDAWFYADSYNALRSGSDKLFVNKSYNALEYGFVLLNSILAFMHLPFQVLLFIVSTFVSVVIVLFINKLSENKFMSLLMYIALGFFAQTLSAYRQIIAFAFILLAIMRLIDKKLISTSVLILVATTFHVSALICFIMIPLRYIKPKISIVVPVFAVAILGAFFFPQILKLIEICTPIDYYTKYYIRLTEYVVASDIVNTLYSFAVCVVFVVLWITRIKWLKLDEKDLRIYDFFLLIYMFVPMFRVVGLISDLPQLLNRLNVYFFISLIILIPLFIKGLNQNKKLYIAINCAAYVVICVYMVYLYAIKNTCGAYPFVFGF